MTRSRLVVLAFAVVLTAGCKKSKPEWEQGSGSGSDSDQSSGEKHEKIKTPLSSGGDSLDNATAISLSADRACAIVEEKVWCWDPGQPAAQVTTPGGITAI